MNQMHHAMLDELRKGPRLDGDLTDAFGSDYIDIVTDLLANDYPIWKEHTSWQDLAITIYYLEKPGQELAPCVTCKSHRRSQGPFCSSECESVFVKEAMSELRRRKKVRDLQRESAPPQAKETKRTHEAPKRKLLFGEIVLRNVVPAATVIHLSKKAQHNKKLTPTERSALSYLGNKLYVGQSLTETERQMLDTALTDAVQSGLPEDPCPGGECSRCKQLVEILDLYGIPQRTAR